MSFTYRKGPDGRVKHFVTQELINLNTEVRLTYRLTNTYCNSAKDGHL